MNTTAEAPLTPIDVLPDLIAAVQEAAANGQTFHDLSIQNKGRLALLGYFTTDPQNVRDPGPLATYHGHRLQENMLTRLAANTDRAMCHVPSFAQARREGTLGLSMAAALAQARTVRYHGVYVADPRHKKDRATGMIRVVDGVATARLATFALPDDEQASTALHEMFQGLYGKDPLENVSTPLDPSPDWEDPVNPWSQAWVPSKKTYLPDGTLVEDATSAAQPKPRTIEVTELNEYERIVTEAQWTLIRKELAKIGVVLIKEKVPLADWLQTETMPTEIRDWLEAMDATYRRMHEAGLVQADYVDDPGGERLAPGRREHLIAPEPSALSKVKRDAVNGLIHALEGRGGDGSNNPSYQRTAPTQKGRGDSRFNKEQHPNPRQRYFLERGVYLKRPRPKKGESYYAPAASRPLNVVERALISMQETWYEVKANPKARFIKALPTIAEKALGGVSDIVVSGSIILLKAAVAIGKGAANYAKDIRARGRQREQSRARLDTILAELRQKEQDILAERIANVFPDTSLAPSRQLELIVAMTTMMRANLAYPIPDATETT